MLSKLTKVSFRITLGKPVFDEEMKQAAVSALANDRHAMGENVYKFEEEFSRYLGVKYAVSTCSGTAALHVALVALGLNDGDEVVTTPLSFIASANCIIQAGGTPKFVDISLEDYNIDSMKVMGSVSYRTKVLLPVHLFGYPADLDGLKEISDSNGLFIVEDACQAHGAVYKGIKVGGLGDVGCFSFYPSKNFTVLGDGGMAVTNNEYLAQTMAKLRNCGRTSQYEHDVLGFTYRLNSVNAAIGRVQLRRLDEWNRLRVEDADRYRELLQDLNEVKLPPRGSSKIQPVYHQFVILAERRDELKKWLEEQSIQCGIHYPIPIHMQPVYRRLYGYQGGEFPLSEEFSKNCLSIPIHPSLSHDDIQYVCEQIKGFYEKMS